MALYQLFSCYGLTMECIFELHLQELVIVGGGLDFPNPIKRCLIKAHSLKGQIESISNSNSFGFLKCCPNVQMTIGADRPLVSSRHPNVTEIQHLNSTRLKKISILCCTVVSNAR